ncbi:hypothetical protein IMSAGC020_02210 [Lachnospiraceae bacterium]|nr:hypothetical protein IMSAGC020_02210 [Lachnospiraceae bacterium]
MEECKPERIVLVHVQYARNPDDPSFRVCLLKGCIVKIAVQLVFEQVRKLVVGFLLSKTAFTAVSRDEFPSAAEMVDGQTAVVGTAPAFGHGGGVFKSLDLFNGEHGRSLAVHIALPSDEGGSKSSHDPGDIRTDGLAVCNLLEASKHGIVVKSAALHDDVIAEFGGVRHLDDLE